MNASAAIALKVFPLASCHTPLAWLPGDIATNRHGSCGLLSRLPFVRGLGKMGAV
jgi:hypothetical protein